MEAARTSETAVSYRNITRRHKPYTLTWITVCISFHFVN